MDFTHINPLSQISAAYFKAIIYICSTSIG